MVRQLGPTITVLCLRLNEATKIRDFRGYLQPLTPYQGKVAVKRILALYWGAVSERNNATFFICRKHRS